MDDILEELGLGRLKQRFELNSITPKVVINLKDDEFDLLGIEKIGQRVVLRERCRDYITASEFPEESLVMKRLRSLQASRKGKMKKPSLVNNRKVKDTRRICLGWKHFENGHYKMVTLNKGGGIIHHDFSKTCTMDEMIAICNNHYFPNGINTQKGIQIKDVECYLANFTGTPIQMELKSGNPFNLGDFLDEINSSPVRLYLHTRMKQSPGPSGLPSTSNEQLPGPSGLACTSNEQVFRPESDDSDFEETDSPTVPIRRQPHTRLSVCNASSYNPTTSTSLATTAISSTVTNTLLSASNESDLEDFDLVQPKRKRPLRRAALRFRQTLGSTFSQQQTGHRGGVGASFLDTDPIEVIDSEDEELQQVLEESLLSYSEKTPSKAGDIQVLLKTFQAKLNKFDKQEIIVFRKRVLDSAFRALKRPSFDVECKLYVKFSGELGLDHGGPRREFFRLAMHELSANPALFTGNDDNKIFTHNLNALEQDQYRMAGKLVAMSLAQEGPCMGFLNKELFMLMTGLNPNLTDFDLSLIPDIDTRHTLEELRSVDSEGSKDTFLSKYGDWMIDQGIPNVWKLKLSDIPMTMTALVKQTIYHRTASEVDQFCKGLNDVCGLMTDVKKNPKAWQTMFCDTGMPLSKDKFLEICEMDLSAEGSNKRNGEEETIYSLELFLQEIQDRTVPVSFGELLAFATGADKIPPGGFGSKIMVMFYDQEEESIRLPFVSTCALNFSLPRSTTPEKLKELLTRALKESLGFEKC